MEGGLLLPPARTPQASLDKSATLGAWASESRERGTPGLCVSWGYRSLLGMEEGKCPVSVQLMFHEPASLLY